MLSWLGKGGDLINGALLMSSFPGRECGRTGTEDEINTQCRATLKSKAKRGLTFLRGSGKL